MRHIVKASDLQTGDKVEGNGDSGAWEVTQHTLPFGEGDSYVIVFKNIETSEELTRYVLKDKKFIVL